MSGGRSNLGREPPWLGDDIRIKLHGGFLHGPVLDARGMHRTWARSGNVGRGTNEKTMVYPTLQQWDGFFRVWASVTGRLGSPENMGMSWRM